MSQPSQQEILSAYLDGEATEEECRLAEKLLANDSEFSSLMSQWLEVGEALRSQTPPVLPVGFSDQVMERIFQETLVREGDGTRGDLLKVLARDPVHQDSVASQTAWSTVGTPASPPTEVDKFWHKRFRSRFQMGLVSLGSLAAGWLLATFVLPGWANPERLASVSPPGLVFSGSEVANRLNGDPASKMEADLNLPRESESAIESAIIQGFIEPSNLRNLEAGLKRQSLSRSPDWEIARAVPGDEFKPVDAGALAQRSSQPTSDAQVLESANPSEMETAPPAWQPAASGFAAATESLCDFGDSTPIEQLYFVDFKSEDPPLAVVSEIFTSNGILILNDPVEGLAQPALADLISEPGVTAQAAPDSKILNPIKPDGLNHLQAYSAVGIEAVYVVATRDQMENAIRQLSDKADVSGFHLPSGLAANLLNAGISSSETPDRSIADQTVFPHGFQPMEQLIAEERSNLTAREKLAGDSALALNLTRTGGAGVGGRSGEGVFHLERATPLASSPALNTPSGTSPLGAFPKIMAQARQLQPFAALRTRPEDSNADLGARGRQSGSGAELAQLSEWSDQRAIEDPAGQRSQFRGDDSNDAGAMVKFLLLIKTRSSSTSSSTE
jgi:hypothetical protein